MVEEGSCGADPRGARSKEPVVVRARPRRDGPVPDEWGPRIGPYQAQRDRNSARPGVVPGQDLPRGPGRARLRRPDRGVGGNRDRRRLGEAARLRDPAAAHPPGRAHRDGPRGARRPPAGLAGRQSPAPRRRPSAGRRPPFGPLGEADRLDGLLEPLAPPGPDPARRGRTLRRGWSPRPAPVDHPGVQGHAARHGPRGVHLRPGPGRRLPGRRSRGPPGRHLRRRRAVSEPPRAGARDGHPAGDWLARVPPGPDGRPRGPRDRPPGQRDRGGGRDRSVGPRRRLARADRPGRRHRSAHGDGGRTRGLPPARIARFPDDAAVRSRRGVTMGFRVQLTQVSKRYEGDGAPVVALDGVTLSVEAGEVVAVTGPSGSGKSTLLHVVGAMDRPDGGTARVGRHEVTTLSRAEQADYRRKIGFVFQRFHLLPALTVRDNVVAPLLPYRTHFDKFERAKELLATVGLSGRERSLPSRLSGGEQQRVAIARALINEPGLLLADEPTGNLDSATGSEIVQLILDLRSARGMTVIVATHDPVVASRCDRVVRLRVSAIVDEVLVGKSMLDAFRVLGDIGRMSPGG